MKLKWIIDRISCGEGGEYFPRHLLRGETRAVHINRYKYLIEMQMFVKTKMHEGTEHEFDYWKPVKSKFFDTVREAKQEGRKWVEGE